MSITGYELENGIHIIGTSFPRVIVTRLLPCLQDKPSELKNNTIIPTLILGMQFMINNQDVITCLFRRLYERRTYVNIPTMLVPTSRAHE